MNSLAVLAAFEFVISALFTAQIIFAHMGMHLVSSFHRRSFWLFDTLVMTHSTHESRTSASLERELQELRADSVRRGSQYAAAVTRLHLAIEAGRMAVWEVDVAGQVLIGSPELNVLMGYPPEHVLTLDEARSRYAPGEQEKLQAAGRAAMEAGEPRFEVEYQIIRLDGQRRWLMLRGETQFGEGGIPARVLGVVADITERKRVEEELAESEANLRAALSAASLAVFDYDHDLGLMKPSPEINAIYGYPGDHALTIADIRARYHPEDVEKIRQIMIPARDPGMRFFEMEFRLMMPNGAVKWINGKGEYLRHRNGQISRSRGVVRDVTEERTWQETQKLLVGELDHRVKNTLAIVQTLVAQSLRSAPSLASAHEKISERLKALAAANLLLTRENWSGAAVSEVVADALAPALDIMGSRIDLCGPPARIDARPATLLVLALHELATNAMKYGALANESGRVRVSWKIEEPAVRLLWCEEGGPSVAAPASTGFGTQLIQRGLASEPGISVGVEYLPQGVRCEIQIPMTSS